MPINGAQDSIRLNCFQPELIVCCLSRRKVFSNHFAINSWITIELDGYDTPEPLLSLPFITTRKPLFPLFSTQFNRRQEKTRQDPTINKCVTKSCLSLGCGCWSLEMYVTGCNFNRMRKEMDGLNWIQSIAFEG